MSLRSQKNSPGPQNRFTVILAHPRKPENIGLVASKDHVAEMIHDLLGRLAMSSKDRRLLLALFSKGVDSKK